MNKAKLATINLAIYSSALFFSTFIYAVTPPNLTKKYFRLQTEVDYFRTEANYADDGSGIEDLTEGQFYQNINIKTGGFYSYSRKGAFSAHLKFSNGTSQSPTEQRTNTQFSEAIGNFYYQPISSPVEVITTLGLIVPFNRVDPETDDALNGEGAFVAKSGIWILKEFSPVTFNAFVGYDFRDEGRSHLLPWSLGGEISFDSFYFGGEVYGYESLTEDEFTDTPAERTNVVNRVNGSSLKYYSVNPKEIAAKFWLGIDLTAKTFIYFGLGQTINGQNSAAGLTAYTGLEVSIDMFGNKKAKAIFDRDNNKDINRFEVEAKEYDKKLFDKKYQQKTRKKKLKEKQMLNEAEEFFESSP